MTFLKKIPFLIVSLISVNSFASDASALDEAEALAVDAKFYAASYNVPYDEAVRRLIIMHGAGAEISNLRNKVKADLQGIYFDNSKNDFGLKVNVANYSTSLPKSLSITPKSSQVIQNILSSKGNTELRKKFNVSDSDIRIVATQYSKPLTSAITVNKQAYKTKQDRLKNITSKRLELKKAIPNLTMVYDDEKTGVAKVYVKSDTGNSKQIAENILNVPVELIVVPYSSRVATRGGSPLLATAPASVKGQIACFSGFIGKRNGVLGIITAGHCAYVGQFSEYEYSDRDGTKYKIPLLPSSQPITSGWRDDGVADLGFLPVGTTTAQAAKAEFYADSSVNYRKLTATKSRAGTAWDNGTVNGAYICHLGKTAENATTLTQSCGEVDSINAPNLDGNGNTFVVVKNTDGNAGYPHTGGLGSLRCYGGDSGSPWFALTTGYGIMHSCAWQGANSSTPVTIATYTSLDYLNSIGATIVTQ